MGDMLMIFAILILFVEIVKATRLGSRSIVDHILSLVLFIAMLGEFMIVRQAATSTFLLLVTLSFVDVVGGFSVTIRSSQRDIALEGIEKA
jgi:O-antigen ligase